MMWQIGNYKNTNIPALGLGTYSITGQSCVEAVADAISQGYRHIDTAQMYGNEAEVGSGIKSGGIAREQLFITTKVLTENFGRRDFIPSVEESLRKLKLDYVDLLLLHWPGSDDANKTALEQLVECRHKGYVKLVGVSNFTLHQLGYAVQMAPVVCNQVEYHPYLGQEKILDFLRSHDMFLTAYRPLVKGAVQNDSTIQALAKKYNRTEAQIVLRWMIQQPAVAAIPKAASHANRANNLNIFDFELAQEDMQTLFSLNKKQRFVNPGWAPQWD